MAAIKATKKFKFFDHIKTGQMTSLIIFLFYYFYILRLIMSLFTNDFATLKLKTITHCKDPKELINTI